MRIKKKIVSMLLLLASASCFAASTINYQQTQWEIASMTDQSGVTDGVFPYSYDTYTSSYMLHLGGKVDLQNIDQHTFSSLTVSIQPDANGYYFVSSDSSKEKIPYTVEVFVRSRLVNAYSDYDVAITGATFGGSGEYGLEAIQGSSTTDAKFIWVKDEKTVSIPIPLENASGTKYQNTHVDILVVFGKDYSGQLTEDYSTTFFCNYTLDGTDIHTFPFTVLGTGGHEEEEEVKTHTFQVTPQALAQEYLLDDATNISSYQSIASVAYTATMTNNRYNAPSITDSLCTIVLSPTSDYMASGTFKFVNTKDSSITIPYYLEMKGTGTQELFMADKSENSAYYTDTSTDLSGDEYYAYPSGDGDRRYVVVPMVVDGTDSTGQYSKTYSYEGDIRIIIPDDITYGTTGLSYREALSNNSTDGYFSAGVYKSTIYISTIVQY